MQIFYLKKIIEFLEELIMIPCSENHRITNRLSSGLGYFLISAVD